MRKACFVLILLMLAVPAFGQGLLDLNAENARIHAPQMGKSLVDAGGSADAVRAYIGLSKAGAADALSETARFALPKASGFGGVEQIRMTQKVAGLDVYGAYVKATFDDMGRLVHVIDASVNHRGGLVKAQISTDDALVAALAAVHPLNKVAFRHSGTDGNVDTFAAGKFFHRAPTVQRIAVPMTDGSMQEGFLVETWTAKSNLLHHTVVGAFGEVLKVQLRTNTDSYNVVLEEPISTPQAVENGPGAGNAQSPIGWLDAGNHTAIHITGNNVAAYLDRDTSNSADATYEDGSTPATISDGNFLAPIDLNSDPTVSTNQAVAVQTLFYMNNVIHDKLYLHGFVEATRNFQNDNFGNGGNGNDAVNAEAQDGSGLNNANFSTPSDGSPGRMQMYIWDITNPRRDGDVDTDIIWHEYGHGLTWRMIGSMSGPMSGAIGEGNSDVLAIYANLDDVVGEYSTNDPFGIRSEAYTGYSRTYGDFTGSSVHFDGEIYAATMWHLWELYQQNAISLDTLWSDMIGGMNFTPAGPAMEDMRDGILAQADSSRDCIIWEAFAAFGIGEGASGTVKGGGPFGGGNVTITESFTVPSSCGGGGCTPTETNEVSCNDGLDNDCDGLVDADDPDCQGGQCTPVGGACVNDSECCSNKCKGPNGGKTCK